MKQVITADYLNEIQALLNAIAATNDYTRRLELFKEIKKVADKYMKETK